jgi:hypothetical protein
MCVSNTCTNVYLRVYATVSRVVHTIMKHYLLPVTELLLETQWASENYIHLYDAVLKETCFLYNLCCDN